MNDINKIIKERQDKILAQIAASGLAGKVFPEMSKIRLHLPLKANTGQYIFNIKSQDVDNVVTFALDRNDVFIPNLWGVRIVLKNSTTGAMKEYTFAPKNDGVNPSVFPVGFASDGADALYEGNVQWILDSNIAMSAYPMEYFKHVPETQGLFVLDSNDAAIDEGIQLQHNINDELELLYSKYQICGTRDHKITVFFDAAGKSFTLAGTGASDWTPYVELLMLGFLVKGGCETPTVGKNPFGAAVGQW